MAFSDDIAGFEAALDNAIFETLNDDVAEAIRAEMSRHLESYEYKKSRGPTGRGVRDPYNFEMTLEQSGDTTTLTMRDIARFQSSNQGNTTLAEAVESGDPAYHMPGPRPFLSPTQKAMEEGEAEAAFAAGMAKRGFGDAMGAISI